MSHEFYRILHVAGILLLFSSLAGIWGLYAGGGTPQKNLRVTLAALHGLGLAIILLSGFALAGQLGALNSLPLWLVLKAVIWLALGAGLALAKRKALWGIKLMWLWVILGTLAGYLAIYKPF